MTEQRDTKRYRPNVGLALFHREGLVFLGKRAGTEGPVLVRTPAPNGSDASAPAEAVRKALRFMLG